MNARILIPVTATAAAIAAVTLVGTSQSTADVPKALTMAAVPATPLSFPSLGTTLQSAPADATPSIGAGAAVEAARADGVRPDAQESIKPVVRLVSMETYIPDPQSESGAPAKTVAPPEVLAWDVTYPDAPQVLHGPMGRPAMKAAPCDLHVMVDANTGHVIESFQADCRVSPTS